MLGSAFTRLPVTFVLIMVSSLLYSLTIYLSLTGGDTGLHGGKPGVLSELVRTDFPEIHGMISLWKGEWWRLTISAFHHANLLHLVMNVMAFWMFADLLEPRLGRFRYLLFCLLAATFSILPEAALDQSAVGISGMVFALFGLLLVVRRHDEEIAERMHPSLVPVCFVSLFICIPLTIFFEMPIANGAHLLGLVYGAAVGWLCFDQRLQSRLASYLGLAALHLGLFLCILLLMKPTWNGRYYAWKAITTTQSISDWKKAVELEPSLNVGWASLTEHSIETGDLHQAWRTALKGAKLNRTSTEMNDLARYVWRKFSSAPDRAVALDEIHQMFGDEADAWIERFELPLPGTAPLVQLAELPFPDLPVPSPVRLNELLDVPAQVPGITRPLPVELPPGDIDPNDPQSARLGTTL